MLVSVGCNKTDTPPATYGVYVKSVTVEEDVCTVRLSRSGKIVRIIIYTTALFKSGVVAKTMQSCVSDR